MFFFRDSSAVNEAILMLYCSMYCYIYLNIHIRLTVSLAVSQQIRKYNRFGEQEGVDFRGNSNFPPQYPRGTSDFSVVTHTVHEERNRGEERKY